MNRWVQALVGGCDRWLPGALLSMPTRRPVLALTFDDAPPRDPAGQAAFAELLAALKNAGGGSEPVRATFFLIADPGLDETWLESLEAGGHEIGNHGPNRRWPVLQRPWEFAQQLQAADRRLRAGRRFPVRWYRPAMALFRPFMLRALAELPGYEPQIALASMTPLDCYPLISHPAFTRCYLSQFLFPGAILLLHAGTARQCRNSTRVLQWLLPELQRRGLQAVTLSQLRDGP